MARQTRVSSGAAQAYALADLPAHAFLRESAIVLCRCRSFIVSQSTGCSQPELLERLYQHFAQPSAWDTSPGAAQALQSIRDSGVPHHLGS